MKRTLIIFFTLFIASCSLFKKKHGDEKGAIARVKDDYLYTTDVPGLTKGLKGTDSIEVLKNYAGSWVRKKLLLQKAAENIPPEDDPSITRKVEEYRESLLLYEYEKALINKRLDTSVRDGELRDWYEKTKADLILEKDVYELYFMKFKSDAPDLDQARKWILHPKDDEDLRKLDGYCKSYAQSFVIDSGVWYEKDMILKNFPLTEADLAAAPSKTYKEFKADGNVWFVKAAGLAKKDQTAPLGFIRDQVAKAIIEKRRLDLIEKIYDRIYQDGVKSKSFEIFVK
ncbi:MAG TPA: hypothetical protein VG603_05170 [Chitinophagales bacterium]|nr:hypothetical protein [Chitinophagales bacterium]